jgi:pimeloyl-ACP methyl ester carboxylesterase
MLRLTLLGGLLVSAFSPLSAMAKTPMAPVASVGTPTVVLVHGAFADATSWDKVAERLRAKGVPVVTVDNPLTSLDADVQVTRRAIEAAPGKVVLVGHSWGGTVITEAGTDAKVSALVYVAAFAPDVGETSAQQGERFPVAPGLQALINRDGFLLLGQAAFKADFAQDLRAAEIPSLYQKQLPLKASALSEPVRGAAWRSRPSWYVLSRMDRMLSPQLQAATAVKIGAELRSIGSSHVSPISEPRAVANAILEAAGLRQELDDSPRSTGG